MSIHKSLSSARPILLILGVAALPSMSQASILAEVILKIEQMGTAPLMTVMANVAENSPAVQVAERRLSAGDRVIIGYGASGAAVYATADLTGLLISPQAEANMTTGLAAGIYPIGSALYSLPPAGQLSLLEEAQDGTKLQTAQALMLSRVDGSIETLIGAQIYPDLAAEVAALTRNPVLYGSQVDGGSLAATALGAVNTGEIVTRVSVSWNPNIQTPDVQILSALVNTGASVSVMKSYAENLSALSSRISYINDPQDGKALVMNLASNRSDVFAKILTDISGISSEIQSSVSTAIGAVNAGSVGHK